jgi:branched-chain amino acid aminotransferase
MEKADLKWGELPFEYVKTDGHAEYYFCNGRWDEGRIVKDETLTLHIAATCLHYGQQCFEGLKVFEDAKGRALIFRVDENAKRMARSAEKIMMQPFPEDLFVDAVFKVVRHNRRFIPPHGSGASLYVRPLLLGITGTVGVKPSVDYLFLVLVTPVGPYFKGGLRPIRLLVEDSVDRAAPEGVGDVKVGGNYAAGLRASIKAKKSGYDEVLYLDPSHKTFVDEAGPANFFGITEDRRYVTPDSKSILPSITNKSLMVLAQELGLMVEKRPVHIDEIFRFKEAGCCGTAAVITPVRSITYKDRVATYTAEGEVGPTCRALYDALTSIQVGLKEDKHGWTREIRLE